MANSISSIKLNLTSRCINSLYNLLYMNRSYANQTVCLAFFCNVELYYRFIIEHQDIKKLIIIDNYITDFERLCEIFKHIDIKIYNYNKISFDNMPHFDVVIMNPPYGNRENGGNTLEIEILENLQRFTDKIIAIFPYNRFISNHSKVKNFIENLHLFKLNIVTAKVFETISTQWKWLGIYCFDFTKKFQKIEIVKPDNSNVIINNEYNERIEFDESIEYTSKYRSLLKKFEDVSELLKQTYNTLVNDSEFITYEDNRINRGKRIFNIVKTYREIKGDESGLIHLKKIIKEYQKKHIYFEVVYKGGYNHEYDEVQIWDKKNIDIFKGQICWIITNKNVFKNFVTYLEHPAFDVMRKYKLRNYKGVAGAAYGNFPAVNFNMQPQEFEKYINKLFFFTKDEKEEAKKHNIHNADKIIPVDA